MPSGRHNVISHGFPDYLHQVSSIRAPIERAVAHLKTWKILFTDYRRPLNTFLDSFRAAIGLYFFELSFQEPSGIMASSLGVVRHAVAVMA